MKYNEFGKQNKKIGKINKMLCLDKWVVEKLELERNMSSFVNDLLRKHYEGENTQYMTDEQKKEMIEILDARIEFGEKMEAIKKKYHGEQ